MTSDLTAGVHDLPVDAYHRLPHLSSTGIRKLVPPSTPAHFQQWRNEPQQHRRVFDIGHAAHRLVLGAGQDFEVIDPADYTLKNGEPATNWQASAVKEAVAKVRAEGRTPLNVEDGRTVTAMAAALARHPLAPRIFDAAHGNAEQTLIWDDPETGVPCRALVDWLDLPNDSRLILKDFKTTGVTAEPSGFARQIMKHGFEIQASHYRAGAIACGLHDDPAFLFVTQEKSPPYLASIVELHPDALALGEVKRRAAIDLYAECVARDSWPGYPTEITLVDLPQWAYGEQS